MERSPEGLPPTFLQERLWLFQRLRPGSTAYNLAGTLRFDGPLAAGVLGAALRAVARRHEALRTHFRAAGETCRQVVVPADQARLGVPHADLSRLASTIGKPFCVTLLRRRDNCLALAWRPRE